MDGNLPKTEKCRLFDEISENEIKLFLSRPSVSVKRFAKDSVILHAGDICRCVCIVAEGRAVGESVGDDGRVEEIAVLNEGDVFGDIIAMSESGESRVTVKSVTDSEIVFIPISEILSEKRLAANLAKSIAEKYFSLRFRLSCVTKTTLREKILQYLFFSSNGKIGAVFEIPFSHSEFADYLSVDRSSLTRELNLLRREGIIDYYGRNYKINRTV